MASPKIETVREQIAWSYANLARADAALKENATKYSKTHYMIRSKLYRGLVSGDMSMRSLYDDERLKMTLPQACCYCGATSNLSVDHLIPRVKGGPDESDNLILACRTCNEKGARANNQTILVAESELTILFPNSLSTRA
jgi:5-methylcytosine-specific restriction endonuclease McrA